MDGVDAALIETDGADFIRPLGFCYAPYPPALSSRLRAATRFAGALLAPANNPEIEQLLQLLTEAHAEVTSNLRERTKSHVELIGMHGQTLAHRPEKGWTWQIGDGARLASRVGLTVVSDFRTADMAAGGQGAPLLPIFHRAVFPVESNSGRVAVLNLGGVANITWLANNPDHCLSFDTGPGNALIDDWMFKHTGEAWDDGGTLSGAGTVDKAVLDELIDHPYFKRPAPKSLDRGAWSIKATRNLSTDDGAATLTAFTAQSVAMGLELCSERPARLLVTGGGRRNKTLMRMLADYCRISVEPVENVGWDGDALEAQAFAYFAVRRVLGQSISFPQTTGCSRPMICGVIDAVGISRFAPV